MKVKDILTVKGSTVWTIKAGETIRDAVKVLVTQKIGALLVLDRDGEIVGIITERDILRAGYELGKSLTEALVENVMTKRLIIGTPEDDLDYIMTVMTENRLRHLPVIQNEKLQGMISIGDVVKAQLHDSQAQIKYLKDYMHGGR